MVRKGTLILVLALLPACISWVSNDLDPKAILRSDASTYLIEVKLYVTQRGNIHFPFDFTKYEDDYAFTIRTKSLTGNIEANDLKLWSGRFLPDVSRIAGYQFENVEGHITFSGDKLKVALFAPPAGRRLGVKLDGTVRLTADTAGQR
jgi:hypothetical protein